MGRKTVYVWVSRTPVSPPYLRTIMDKEQCMRLKTGDQIEYDHKEWWTHYKVLENNVAAETVKLETTDADWQSVECIGDIDTMTYKQLMKEHPYNGSYFHTYS